MRQRPTSWHSSGKPLSLTESNRWKRAPKRLTPRWSLPSRLADNPLVWMLQVNGVVVDIRMTPREVQEEAYRLGLIPLVPE